MQFKWFTVNKETFKQIYIHPEYMQLQFKLVEERFTPTLQFMLESKILLAFRYLNPRVPSVLKFHLKAFAPSWQSITLDAYQKIKDFKH